VEANLSRRATRPDKRIPISLSALGFSEVHVEVVDDYIVEGDRASQVPRLCNGPAARAVAECGIVIVRVDSTTPPVAAARRAEKVSLPMGGIDGRGGEYGNRRVEVRCRRVELAFTGKRLALF
jgi:hypothetical protein